MHHIIGGKLDRRRSRQRRRTGRHQIPEKRRCQRKNHGKRALPHRTPPASRLGNQQTALNRSNLRRRQTLASRQPAGSKCRQRCHGQHHKRHITKPGADKLRPRQPAQARAGNLQPLQLHRRQPHIRAEPHRHNRQPSENDQHNQRAPYAARNQRAQHDEPQREQRRQPRRRQHRRKMQNKRRIHHRRRRKRAHHRSGKKRRGAEQTGGKPQRVHGKRAPRQQ